MPVKRVGLYRLYNYALDKAGEPFGMCDEHAAVYNPPFVRDGHGRVEKLADDGKLNCQECNDLKGV